MSKIIEEIEKDQLQKNIPSVSVGDTVEVSKEIIEGKKKRVQRYQGLVIKLTNTGIRKSITIRKIIDKVGVEKTYLLHSPLLTKIEVKSRGKVRRAKLHYLRDRVGKRATRVKSRD